MTHAHAAGLPIDVEKPAQDATITAETPEDTHEGVSTHISADTSADISEDLAA
jgi:antitoxin component of RelBE/YafQ-DinJ toxin-antitoxin module